MFKPLKNQVDPNAGNKERVLVIEQALVELTRLQHQFIEEATNKIIEEIEARRTPLRKELQSLR